MDELVKRLRKSDGPRRSYGVVTFSQAQQQLVENLLDEERRKYPEIEVHFNDEPPVDGEPVFVKNLENVQGDERDVIFFSPVLSLGVGEGTLRFLNNHGNLFNVAITRARSELVVVGDRQAALESGVKYLSSFAEYSQALAAEEAVSASVQELGPEYPVVPRPELVSDWERVFYKAMFGAGLRPIPQFPESPYTLDFALFQGERKLDIEVDGEAYHRNWDGELCRRDQIRSRRLNDQGWDVMRFWVYEVRDDLDGAIARVKAWFQS